MVVVGLTPRVTFMTVTLFFMLIPTLIRLLLSF